VACIAALVPVNIFAHGFEREKLIDFQYNIPSVESGDDFHFERFEDDVFQVKDTLEKGVQDTLGNDTLVDAKKPFLETQIDYNADDSIIFSISGQQVFLKKNAFVKYGKTELRAHFIELDLEKKEAFAYGIQDSTGTFVETPEFKDGSEEFKCKELKYNFDTGKGLVTEIITEQEGGFVHSEITKKIDENTFYLRNGKYTTCEHEHPHFYVKMTKAKMIKDSKIVSGPAYMVLEDVPLYFVGLPFGFFPFKKKYSSGIILPSYGEEQRRGFNLRQGGYYWAINDYVDLALTGDIFSNGSWGTQIRSQYRKRYRFSGNLSAEYHLNKYGDEGFPDYVKTKDFAVRWTHTQDPKANPYRTFSASVDFSTASNDQNNAYTLEKIVNNQKQSSISYSKRWPDSPFSLSATLRHSQNSRDSTISLSLPDVNFNMTQIYPFRAKGKSGKLTWYDKIGVTYSAKLKNNITTKEDELFNSSLSKDWRNGFQHRIPLSTSIKVAKDLTFAPSVSYEGVAYTNSIRKDWDPAANNGEGGVVVDTLTGFNYAHNYSASASLSYTPKIYGMFTFRETSKVAAIRHVVSPSVSVSYTPEIGVSRDKYFRTYNNAITDQDVEYSIFEQGIFGTPTGAMESGSINFGLDNNLEAKIRTANDTTGNEDLKKIKILESVKFSTSYNMFADSLNWSLIRMTGRTKLFNKKLNLTFGADMDPYDINSSGSRIDKFKGRLTRADVKLGFQISSKDFQSSDDGGGDPVPTGYVDFDIPWSMNVDYGWTYTKPGLKSSVTQTVRLNGNFSLTPQWKFNFSSGYDFSQKEITTSSFGIQRDLHCWQMSFNAIPFGTYQSFNFMINVKSSILQDLKYQKRHAWQDN
jgi:lipopolysaccharide assembly outer membrane protein LptD (OstA)